VLRSYLDGVLFADAFGDEPPVVGLHGWGRSRLDLVPLVEPHGGVSIDLPGFGASPEPPEPWGAERYADLIAKAIEQMHVRPVVLGHSMGGRVAVCLAAARPDLVGALVLTGAPLLRQDPSGAKAPLAFRMAKRLHRLGIVSDERMEAERRKRGSADYRNAQGVMRDTLVTLVNEDYRDQLGRIGCHVELVWGDADTAAPLAVAEEAARLLSDAHLEVLPGVGHDVPREAPGALADALDRALAAA
jgi:pimeloyl-ACP methyl ester carboxylesterase